ncbi:hypothetical protein PG995_004940 [Apiospora arundinis]
MQQFLGSRDFIETLSSSDKQNLLLLLEKDLINYFYCFACKQLHPLRPSAAKGWADQDPSYLECGGTRTDWWDSYKLLRPPHVLPKIPKSLRLSPETFQEYFIGRGEPRNWGPYFHDPKAKLIQWRPTTVQRRQLSWQPRVNGPEVFFHEARQVLKRHHLGEPHGLPLSVLQRRFHFQKRLNLRGYDDLDFSDHFSDEVATELTKSFKECQEKKVQGKKKPTSVKEADNHEATDAAAGTLWKFTHEYDAKVLEGDLFVYRRHLISGPVISSDPDEQNLQTEDFTRLLHDLELPICRHVYTRSPVDGEDVLDDSRDNRPKALFALRGPTTEGHIGRIPSRGTLPDIAPEVTKGTFRFWRDPGFAEPPPWSRSCERCWTDYTYTIPISRTERRWAFELATYHNLGKCQSPDAEEKPWARLNGMARTMRHVTAGTTRERWDGATKDELVDDDSPIKGYAIGTGLGCFPFTHNEAFEQAHELYKTSSIPFDEEEEEDQQWPDRGPAIVVMGGGQIRIRTYGFGD